MGTKESRFSESRETAECGEAENVDQVFACGRPRKNRLPTKAISGATDRPTEAKSRQQDS